MRGGKGSFELFGKVIKRIPYADIVLIIGKRFSGGNDDAAAVGTFDGKGYGGLFMQRLHYRIGKIGTVAGIYDNIAGVSGYFGDGWLPEFFDLGIIGEIGRRNIISRKIIFKRCSVAGLLSVFYGDRLYGAGVDEIKRCGVKGAVNGGGAAIGGVIYLGVWR